MLRHCWLGDRKDIRPEQELDVGLLVVMTIMTGALYTSYAVSEMTYTVSSETINSTIPYRHHHYRFDHRRRFICP